MIYLASPYTHVDAAVRESRFDAACLATSTLLRAGLHVYSPIVHSHPLVRYGLPIEWEFWQAHDCEHLRRCDSVIVLTLDGWKTVARLCWCRRPIRLKSLKATNNGSGDQTRWLVQFPLGHRD